MYIRACVYILLFLFSLLLLQCTAWRAAVAAQASAWEHTRTLDAAQPQPRAAAELAGARAELAQVRALVVERRAALAAALASAG